MVALAKDRVIRCVVCLALSSKLDNVLHWSILIFIYDTVAETEPFQRKVGRLLSEDEKAELIAYLSMNPNAGVLIRETGGIRKLRWARSGRGKSGGIRVIYYFHNEKLPLYLLTLFGKNEKANISMEEKKLLSKMVRDLVKYWSQKQ